MATRNCSSPPPLLLPVSSLVERQESPRMSPGQDHNSGGHFMESPITYLPPDIHHHGYGHNNHHHHYNNQFWTATQFSGSDNTSYHHPLTERQMIDTAVHSHGTPYNLPSIVQFNSPPLSDHSVGSPNYHNFEQDTAAAHLYNNPDAALIPYHHHHHLHHHYNQFPTDAYHGTGHNLPPDGDKNSGAYNKLLDTQYQRPKAVSRSQLEPKTSSVPVANKKERRRTVSINTAFASLRGCIPNVPEDTKLSKIKTLRLATSYINHLMKILSRDDAENTDTEFQVDLTRFKRPRNSGHNLDSGHGHGDGYGDGKMFADGMYQNGSSQCNFGMQLASQSASAPGRRGARARHHHHHHGHQSKGRTGWPEAVWHHETLKQENIVQ